MNDTAPIVIYTRMECHLCDEVEATVREVTDEVDVAVDIDLANVDSDEELHKKYGERVPYVYVDG